MSNNLTELRTKRDAAKQEVRAAHALSSRSFEEWQKQLAIVDDAETKPANAAVTSCAGE
jgi:hypothetical protein